MAIFIRIFFNTIVANIASSKTVFSIETLHEPLPSLANPYLHRSMTFDLIGLPESPAFR